jgi:hypothetical protein
MKLFVWEDVLTDYTSGMVVAIAKDVDEARRVACGGDVDSGNWIARELSAKPEVIDLDDPKAQAWIVYGGG